MKFRYLFVFLTSILSLQAFAGLNKDIRVSLEEPSHNGTYSGISNLRGWAAAPTGIDRIELYINNQYATDVPYGGARADVGRAYPSYKNSDYSGFSMAYNYKALPKGSAKMRVRAYDLNGDYNDAESSFEALKFKSEYISDKSEIDISSANSLQLVNSHEFLLQSIRIEGVFWDVQFKWDSASQGFEISTINNASGGSDGGSSASSLLNSASGYWKIPEFGDQGAIQIHVTNGSEPRRSIATFLIFNNYTFASAPGNSANNVMQFSVDSDPDIYSFGTITFQSSTKAELYIEKCIPNPGASCAPFSSGGRYSLKKEF